MDVLKRSPRQYYRPELDVVRFLAFFLVFLSHNLPRSSTPRISAALKGFAPIYYASANACVHGVSLFFTLSAFLICELLLRERDAAGTVAVKQFYIRRILRIWPLYYLGLIIGAIFAIMPGGNRGDLIGIGWFAIFMGAWQSAVYGWLDSPMYVLWSISVEEQFYLFAPWIVKYFNRKSLYSFCAALILASNAWLYHLAAEHASGDRIWADSLVQFQCFAAGILLCLVLNGRLPRIAVWKRLLLLADSGLCWVAAHAGPLSDFAVSSENHAASGAIITGYALASLGSVMALVAFLGLNAKLIPRWAAYLGRISFGLYVFHALAQDLVSDFLPNTASYHVPNSLSRICASFGLTFVMAALSYRYFETRFLRMKKHHTVIQSQPI